MTRDEWNSTVRKALNQPYLSEQRLDKLREALEGWRDIETAPKDGTPVLFAGRYQPYGNLPGGEWERQVFSWRTLRPDGKGHEWTGPGFTTLKNWNVVWTCWHCLPDPPHSQPDQEGEPDEK